MRNGPGWMRLVAAVASGLLVAGLFPPFNFSWLAWVAMMPLLAALWSIEGKRAGWKGLGLGYLGGAVSCLIQCNWVSSVSWLGAIALPLYLAVYWGLFGWFAATAGNPGRSGGKCRNLKTAFFLGAGWAGVELLRGWIITGFGWNAMGVAFHETRVMAQAADLLGVSGLSMALVFVQTLVLLGLRDLFVKKPGARRDLGLAAVLVACWFGYGKIRIAAEEKAPFVPLKALLVQINIPQEAARVLWTDLEVHQAYEDETLTALEALKSPEGTPSKDWPDWVIWPECALTGRILRSEDGDWGTWQINRDTISQVRSAGPFSLIYGVNELEALKHENQLVQKDRGKAYNSIAAMNPDDDLQTYRKRHLVIFGETIPFVDSIPFLRKIYEQQAGMEYGGSFTPGESLDPLQIQVGKTTVGAIPTVCFEDSVPRLTRKFVRPGPQVIVNVTNDGWFKESAAAAQHFAYARFRAIELRRPMLRSANTGVTAAVDSTGSTVFEGKNQILTDASGSHFTRGSMLATVKIPLQPSFSLFARIGDWGLISLAAGAFVLAIRGRKSPLDASDR